ncbi:acylphosphatase [Microbacterium gilvum]|uniref:acylphosphatase n=1 Tax=Microbacterium gilvum TaxID=1336204 RepID=A0ABP9A5N6_9MICO
MKRVHVVARGVVQGVGFRWSTARQAERRDVAGWVRNVGSDRVEAELEGSDTAVDAVVAWMHSGPVGSRVDGLEVDDADPQGDSTFEVRASI